MTYIKEKYYYCYMKKIWIAVILGILGLCSCGRTTTDRGNLKEKYNNVEWYFREEEPIYDVFINYSNDKWEFHYELDTSEVHYVLGLHRMDIRNTLYVYTRAKLLIIYKEL